jgi:hypothetical protein
MKNIPLIISIIIVIVFNIAVLVFFEISNIQLLIFSGFLSIIVYEIVNYLYFKNKKE